MEIKIEIVLICQEKMIQENKKLIFELSYGIFVTIKVSLYHRNLSLSLSLSLFFFFLVVVFIKFISFLINICFTFSVVSQYLYRYHVLTIFLKLFDFISRVHTCSPSRSHVMPNVFLFLFLFYLFINYYYYYFLFFI